MLSSFATATNPSSSSPYESSSSWWKLNLTTGSCAALATALLPGSLTSPQDVPTTNTVEKRTVHFDHYQQCEWENVSLLIGTLVRRMRNLALRLFRFVAVETISKTCVKSSLSLSPRIEVLGCVCVRSREGEKREEREERRKSELISSPDTRFIRKE